MASHHSRSAEIIPLWSAPLDYERRPTDIIETDTDASFASAVYAFMAENLIAIGSGFLLGMMATVGLAYVVSWFL